jgi:hypothetical protein
MQFKLIDYGTLRKASLSPGTGYKYDVLAVPVQGHLEAGCLGGIQGGTLIVDCFSGRAYLFSDGCDFVAVSYVEEKFGLRGEHAHAVAAIIAQLLGRETNSKCPIAVVSASTNDEGQ